MVTLLSSPDHVFFPAVFSSIASVELVSREQLGSSNKEVVSFALPRDLVELLVFGCEQDIPLVQILCSQRVGCLSEVEWRLVL